MRAKLARRLRSRLAEAGQTTLAKQLDALIEHARSDLLEQLADLDLDVLGRLRRVASQATNRHKTSALTTIPYIAKDERDEDGRAARRGKQRLRDGKVAFALLAGGDASRLQWDGPKGAFPIGPRTGRSLFRVLVEQLARAGLDYGITPPLAVTTSATTDAATRAFFELNDCFGAPREQLRFACQNSLPSLDPHGELVLATPRRLLSSPDGHGGAAQALAASGILDEWHKAGIDTVCTFQIDNPLVPVVDADLIGRVDGPDTPIATKVIRKHEPGEKLGTMLCVDGRPTIIEYSEIGDHAAATGTDGDLRWPLGSIAVHAFSLEFLRESLQDQLPLHVARRNVHCVGEDKETTCRAVCKFERFLFDVFPRAQNIAVVEADRREYAPIKSHEGAESPETCRTALEALYRSWYEAAGQTPPEGPLELSPLEAMGPDDLRDAQ